MRWILPTLAVTLGGTTVGWSVASAQNAPLAEPEARAVAAVAAAPAVPAPPTLSADRAWMMLQPQVESSPWLSKADETAAWIDQAGNDAQEVTVTVSSNLREFSALMNDHWAGRASADALQAIAAGTAYLVPDAPTKAAALGVVYAIEHADEWALAMAEQTDALGLWIESFTEPYERYAAAYQQLEEDPTAESFTQWVESSQALLPYLEKAEKVCAEVDEQLAAVHGRLESMHASLAGADHWSIQWLTSRVDSAVIVPSVERLAAYRADVQLIQGRVAFDHALIASLPGRFERYVIVD
jgi:hypothetical protein